MSPYVIVDASIYENSKPQPSTAVAVIIYDDDVLPVFTSRELTEEFIRAHHAAEEPTRPMPFEIDPIKLAVMVGDPEHGHVYMVFNPVTASPGRWTSAREPMSVNAYRLYIRELTRGVQKLLAEGREIFGDQVPDPEERERLVAVWGFLQADKLAADARACVEEHQLEDGSWLREEPDSLAY